MLIKCQFGNSDGRVGDYELDGDGSVTTGFHKYRVTEQEVDTPRGRARVVV
ncbi:hypothetical protein ACIBI9_39880 [Nonomuraea sp. NPDC050451]|uniref:hypothetical protein n=1 Tax=Nonomuraea sp. NPDC050451 TaxID=3364364 RepID=UPI0037A50BE0